MAGTDASVRFSGSAERARHAGPDGIPQPEQAQGLGDCGDLPHQVWSAASSGVRMSTIIGAFVGPITMTSGVCVFSGAPAARAW